MREGEEEEGSREGEIKGSGRGDSKLGLSDRGEDLEEEIGLGPDPGPGPKIED